MAEVLKILQSNRMSILHTRNGTKFSMFLVICILLVFYIRYLNSVEQPKHQYPQVQKKQPSTIRPSDSRDKQVAELIHFIDQKINDVPFVAFNQTSSAKNSIATILNPPERFCVGDTLVVRVEMFNHLGQKKRWGGDYLHARIHTPNLGAAASGRIEDFNNGSYNVYFALSWEGHVDISIVLFHPSEGVSLLWRIRKADYSHILFTYGYFLNKSQEVKTRCGFQLDPSQQEICEYADKEYGEYLYCYKPPGVPCEALIKMNTVPSNTSYIKVTENEMFTRSNRAVHIPMMKSSIEVLNCNRTPTEIKTKCQPGEQLPFPGGYFFKQQWHPVNCQIMAADSDQITNCLSGKRIYLMGDSTIRQWFDYFQRTLKGIKLFLPNALTWYQIQMAFNLERNFLIQWKKHGHIFSTHGPYTVKEVSYVQNEIDRLAGGSHTVIVISVGMHFRTFPLSVFIRRLLNIRHAIEKLFVRSPDTKVIIKTENTREIITVLEVYGDFYGHIQYILLKKVFSGLNVGIIDAWDMTIAAESYVLHPSDTIVQNQIYWFLSYIC